MRGTAQGHPVIELRAVHRSFEEDEARVDALRGIDLTIARGEFVSVIGPSGSGKSTFLNVIGALDQPTAGEGVLELIEASHDAGRTIVLVTHDMRLASRAQRIVHLRDGAITDITCPSRRDRTLDEILEVGDA